MNKDVQVAWEAALRSGDYAQGAGALCWLRHDGPPLYCCLGVLCELAVDAGVAERVDLGGQRGYRAAGSDDPAQPNYLPAAVQAWSGLTYNPRAVDGGNNASLPAGTAYAATFADLNDAHRSFAEIADLVAAL